MKTLNENQMENFTGGCIKISMWGYLVAPLSVALWNASTGC